MKRIFSGIRPTGVIHLGNYLGALRNWVSLQQEGEENLFCIVDLHALTTLEETDKLAEHTLISTATYLAAGISPEKSSIFAQSHVPEITELTWIFGCITPLGWLNRMTQYKEKSAKTKDLSCLGLLAYPVLMAADILLYKATHVPVGEDQKQHLELARDIAGLFNRQFGANGGKDIFPLPEPMIMGEGTRVMSLRDGTSKMSKSDVSEYSRILLTDDADTIALKIRKAKTDTEPLPAEPQQLEGRPEALNLLTIYAALSDQSLEMVCHQFAGQPFSALKKALTNRLIDTIMPIGNAVKDLLKNQDYLETILRKGRDQANVIASKHMAEIREVVGLLRL
jgi:tryptophanyl-tRNA synthetase